MADQMNSFIFSLKNLPEAEREIDNQINLVDSRIDKLVKGVTIGHVPILGHLLGMTHEREELEKLGKALLRVAPLIEKHDDLKRRKAIFELVQKEPGWLAGVFGDFSNEIEEFTRNDIGD